MTIYYKCPACAEEIEVAVLRGDNDLPEVCPHCAKPLPEDAHAAVMEAADEQAREPLDDDHLR